MWLYSWLSSPIVKFWGLVEWVRDKRDWLFGFICGFIHVVVGFCACIIGLNLFVNTVLVMDLVSAINYGLILAGVAYYTLLERKLLAAFQLRVGPNKVGFLGLGQPVADAINLFLKEFVVPNITNRLLFVMAPCIIFIICVAVWVIYPVSYPSLYFFWGYLLFVCATSCSVYGVVICGWSSNSKYAYLGSVRAAAQFISYEVCMVIVVLAVVFVSHGFSFDRIIALGILSFGIFSPLFVIWVVTVLAETNRAPFDFVEGESELVSGFNVEYSGVCFSLIFIAEYSMVLFISIITGTIWLGGVGLGVIVSCMVTILVGCFIILCRGGLPRYRYDLLINLTWKYFLPLIMACLAVVVIMS